jgi:hypothetical protein
VSDRAQAQMVQALRRLQQRELPEGPQELEALCDLCGTTMPEDHRHLMQLDERRLVCVCESCWALRSGDPEFRPTGARVVWLEDFDMPDVLWGQFRIPIGLAFFLRSADTVVALYPSPAGATESELDMDAWGNLTELNPALKTLESDGEALVVNRLADPPQYAIAPTDQAYRLVGLVKARWQGSSGAPELESAVAGFFDELRARSAES